MFGDEAASLACDGTVPNVARIYDYYLGGKDNFAVDREAARRVLGAAPDVPLAALENRAFLQRAARFLVFEAGISQFIDIGPGLPTQGNLHQIVHQYNSDAHVVYVDNDPVVLAHCRSLLQGDRTRTISGDVRAPEQIFANQELQSFINLSEPVALCLTLVLHFIRESDDPYQIMAKLTGALAAGSYLLLSHVTGDERDVATISQITDVYDEATAPLVPRSRDEFIRFFDGFTILPPGVVFLSQWRPSNKSHPEVGTHWAYAGLGRDSSFRMTVPRGVGMTPSTLCRRPQKQFNHSTWERPTTFVSKLIDEFVLTLAGICAVAIPPLGIFPAAAEPPGPNCQMGRPLPRRNGGGPCRS